MPGSCEALMRCGIRNVVGVYILSVFILLGDLVKFPCTRSVSFRPAAFYLICFLVYVADIQ